MRIESTKIKNSFSSSEPSKKNHHNIFIVLFLLFVLLILIWGIFNSDSSSTVRSMLEERGLDTAGIEFSHVKEVKWKLIYRSSEPLPLGNGEYCDQWEIVKVGTTGLWRYVRPYPNGGWPPQFNVNIRFTAEEYEALSEQLDGQTVEDYIKKQCLRSVQ